MLSIPINVISSLTKSLETYKRKNMHLKKLIGILENKLNDLSCSCDLKFKNFEKENVTLKISFGNLSFAPNHLIWLLGIKGKLQEEWDRS